MPNGEFTVRPVRPEDDAALAQIITTTMAEFGATADNHAISDEIPHMAAAYQAPRAAFWVVERGGRVLGGGGIGPLAGAESHVCELRKMYLLAEARGTGAGRRVAEHALAFAKEAGYTECYLQTREVMQQARALYEKLGFKRSAAPKGVTGQFGCDAWYRKAL